MTDLHDVTSRASGSPGWSSSTIAQKVAADLASYTYVNLGIGMPLKVASHLGATSSVLFHSENGLLGLGSPAPQGAVDPDISDAGKKYVTLVEGASSFDSALSFAMIRGHHLDVAVLGAHQVSQSGDLANWFTPGATPGVGGAMDLALGARHVWVMMRLLDRNGAPKLVQECTLPLTARQVVSRVYTEVGLFRLAEGQVALTHLAEGWTHSGIQALLDFPITNNREEQP